VREVCIKDVMSCCSSRQQKSAFNLLYVDSFLSFFFPGAVVALRLQVAAVTPLLRSPEERRPEETGQQNQGKAMPRQNPMQKLRFTLKLTQQQLKITCLSFEFPVLFFSAVRRSSTFFLG